MFIYIFCKPILLGLHESPSIASAAAVFVYGLIPQIFAYACNFPIQKFLQAQSVIFPSACISAGALVLHLLLSWVVIFKLGGGLLGAALVASLSWWIIVAAQFVYILASKKFKHTWRGFSIQAFSGLWDFFKLSLASAVMLCLETCLESNPDSKQANLQQLGIIALNLASTNATNTSSYIKTTLLSNKTLGPVNEQALEDCSDQYLDAIQQLDDSLAALLANATNDVRTWVRAAVADVESCENGFKKKVPGQHMLLSSRNAVFRQLCNNVLILLRLAAPAVLVYLINSPCPCPPESSLATSAILSLLLPLLAMWCPILSLWPHVREGKCCGNCGQSYGARRYEMFGKYLQRAILRLRKANLILLDEPTTVASAAQLSLFMGLQCTIHGGARAHGLALPAKLLLGCGFSEIINPSQFVFIDVPISGGEG
ncbi:hypothetical protein POTOM_016645 [Populus tomentosa]|uniref:Pectinesterase inhibitor domain-containing protein n=1 Tax=Populus tomentosa TaxID=118781 RepID=A0A8X8D3X9_POPTO|nr:hypothetical protein POTOM_016645 [Populus tomentosa]